MVLISLQPPPLAASLARAIPVFFARVAAIVTLLAIVLGRSHPRPPALPPSAPRRAVPAALVVERLRSRPPFGLEACLLDPATGLPCTSSSPSGIGLFLSSASPWRDSLGRSQLVGVSTGLDLGPASAPAAAPSIVRLSLPSLEVLDRIPLDRPLLRPPCWSSDLSARILFVDARGSLCRLDFEDRSLPCPPAPTTLAWRCGIDGSEGHLTGDLSWPADPRLGGRVLASLCPDSRRPEVAPRPEAAWWLRLDDARLEVVDAGPLISPSRSGPGTGTRVVRCPVIGPGPDGSPLLAFLERDVHADPLRWRLMVSPIGFEAVTGRPSASRDRSWALAEDCLAIPPVFSGDGLGLVCVSCSGLPGGVQLRRFNLTNPPSCR